MAELGTLCTKEDVAKYAGENANADAIDEVFCNVAILESEGLICALARYDFVTNYASLTSIAKEFLRHATATLTAIASISYDMSGYTSRVEAEDMLNLLLSKWKACEALLLDQKIVTWSIA
jgi:hypothetical protein